MQTLNQSLLALYLNRIIGLEDALGRSADAMELQKMISDAASRQPPRPGGSPGPYR